MVIGGGNIVSGGHRRFKILSSEAENMVKLGSIWSQLGQFGVDVGSIWGRFGVSLGLVCGHFG